MPKLVFTLAGVSETQAAQERIQRTARRGFEESKRAKSEEQRLNRLLQTTLREQETAQEKYNRKVADLKALMSQAGDATKQKLQSALNDLNKEFDPLSKNMRRMKEDSDETFGSKGQQQIIAWGTRLAGTLGAFVSIQSIVRQINADVQRGQEVGASAEESFARLKQIAQGDQQLLNTLGKQSRELFARGAVTTPGAGAETLFALQSANLRESFETFAQLGQAGAIGNLPEFVAGVKRFQGAGGGEAETGDAAEIIRKAFAASGKSAPRTEELLAVAPIALAAGGGLGISDEEVFAALAPLAEKLGPEQAATSLARLLTGLDVSGFAAGGFGVAPAEAKLKAAQESLGKLQTPIKGILSPDAALIRRAELEQQLGGITGPHADVRRRLAQAELTQFDTEQSRLRRQEQQRIAGLPGAQQAVSEAEAGLAKALTAPGFATLGESLSALAALNLSTKELGALGIETRGLRAFRFLTAGTGPSDYQAALAAVEAAKSDPDVIRRIIETKEPGAEASRVKRVGDQLVDQQLEVEQRLHSFLSGVQQRERASFREALFAEGASRQGISIIDLIGGGAVRFAERGFGFGRDEDIARKFAEEGRLTDEEFKDLTSILEEQKRLQEETNRILRRKGGFVGGPD